MCIIFIYTKGSEVQPKDCCLSKYKLIVAANRDEFFERPAASAHFWTEFPYVLAGQDQTPGKEGGTWLGFCKDGRIGLLTNYRGNKKTYEEKKGRGSLLARYFCHLSSDDFRNELESHADEYSPFSMVLGDVVKDQQPVLYHFPHYGNQKCKELAPGINCISNSEIDSNWDKVIYGKQLFQDLLKSNDSSPDVLIDSLLNKLLLRGERFTDDDPVIKDAEKKDLAIALSSIFVQLPPYGTRANTIILVDSNDDVIFYERAMVSPIENGNPQWKVNEFKFPLNETSLFKEPRL